MAQIIGHTGMGGGIRMSGASATSNPILSVRRLAKTFGGTRALRGLDLDIACGEIHALVGHNGSGKSTLIKTLAGYQRSDPGGEILVDGEALDSVGEHRQHDLMRFVHQDLGLVLQLSATDNIALRGAFVRHRGGTVDWKAQESLARELLATFDVHLDVRRPLSEATPVERTVVAIAGALQGWDSSRGLLVLDEPSAVLPPTEVQKLLAIVRGLRARGLSVLYVSHRLEEILEIADTVTVLRDGQLVTTCTMAGLSKTDLISLMLGTAANPEDAELAPQPATEIAQLGLQGRAIRSRCLRGVDLSIAEGEIVGLAGLPGSGREELPYALAGALAGATGELRVSGDGATWSPVKQAKTKKIAFVPGDRGTEGVIREMSIAENLSLAVVGEMGRFGLVSRAKERRAIEQWADRLTVTNTPTSARIDTLSGGNQQKVLIGRSLARNPRVLILSEPTAGVDIGARGAIYELINESAAKGMSVLISSSDVTDLLAVCHRVVVLRDGRAVRELNGARLTERALVRAMEGVDLPTSAEGDAA